MRFLVLVSLLFSVLLAKEIQTPLENIKDVEFLGKSLVINVTKHQDFVKKLHEEAHTFLESKGYKHALATLYKRDFEKKITHETLDEALESSYLTLATRRYDLKNPVPKIMVNYLDDTHPDFKNIKIRRQKAIEKEKEALLSTPLHVKQQFFLHKNSLFGLDIAFSEQSEPLEESSGGRLKFGLFIDKDELHLFIHDTLSMDSSIDHSTKKVLIELTHQVRERIHTFFKPQKNPAHTYLAKAVQTIREDQLVITAIADDSDSSRIECDPSLTLNNSDVSEQLASIDAYIYKVEPHYSDFNLPSLNEGIVWKTFYWKHKKAKLVKELSALGMESRHFKEIVKTFILQKEGTLKRLFRQGELAKVETLFENHLKQTTIQSEPLVALFKRLDIMDVLALGMK